MWLPKTIILTSFLLCWLITTFAWSDKIKLKDVETLTLQHGHQTTGRRSSTINQLNCVGGSARGVFQPKVVQCYNRGFDGYDIQWECKTDMSEDYRFGEITVICEGYDHPNDEYILKGSCGLEYSLEYSEQGMRNQRGESYQKQPYEFQAKQKDEAGFNPLVILFLFGLAIYLFYAYCLGSDNRPHPSNRGGDGGGNFPGDGGPPPPGFRPADPPSYDDACGRGYGDTSSSGSHSGTTGPGFWTGLGMGGLAGYLFGNRQPSYYNAGGYQQRHYGYQNPQAGPSWFNGPSHSSGSSFFGSSRTASGFGGTRRR